MTALGASDEDVEQKVLALPELRGGLLPHALKKIAQLTGVYSCELENLEDGAQVTISGPRGQLTTCMQMVLRAAVGDFQDLSTVVELVHQVTSSTRKLTDTTNSSGSPLQVIGRLAGCDLTLNGSQLQIHGPSAAIAKGAMKMVEKFLASDSADVNQVFQAPRSNSGASDLQNRAAALRRPRLRRPSNKDAEERLVEIANLSRMRLLNCQGAVIQKLEDLHGVLIKVLEHKDYPGVPKDSLPLRIKGDPTDIADCEGSLWLMSQDDFSAIGFAVTRMRLPRIDMQELAGIDKDDSRTLRKLFSKWREVLAIDASWADKGNDRGPVIEIEILGEIAKVMALKAAVWAFRPVVERFESRESELVKNTKLLKEIANEIVKRGLAASEDDNMVPPSGDKSEVKQLQQYMRRRGEELLHSLGSLFLIQLLGLPDKRLTGMVKDHVGGIRGQQRYEEDLVIDCDDLKGAIDDGTVFIPKSQSSGLRLGDIITFRLVMVEDLCTAADLEHAAWHPPPAEPGLMRGAGPAPAPAPAPAPDRVDVVIEVRSDELGRRYFWNHQEMTSDWTPPPPHIGYWERLLDYRSGRHYYFNHGTRKSVWKLPLAQAPPPPDPSDLTAPPGIFTQPSSVRLQPMSERVQPAEPPRLTPEMPSPPEPPEPSEKPNVPEPKGVPRIPPTRRPDGEDIARGRAWEEPVWRTNVPNWRVTPSAAQQPYEDTGEEVGTTALDAMIDSHNDEQTELDAIVEEALLRQEHMEAEHDASMGAVLEEGNPFTEVEERELDVDFCNPYGEEGHDFAAFGQQDTVPESDSWWSKDQQEDGEEVKEAFERLSTSSKRQMRKNAPDEELLDRRPPLARRRKRKAEDASADHEKEHAVPRPPPPPKRPKDALRRRPKDAPPKRPDVQPPPPPPPHVPPPLAAKNRPEPPKDPPSWWSQEAFHPEPSTDSGTVPFKPPEPKGPPGPPPGPLHKQPRVNVVKLSSRDSRDKCETEEEEEIQEEEEEIEVEEEAEEIENWQEASDVPVREVIFKQENERSQPQTVFSSFSSRGLGERGRKRVVKSWDSRKKEFVYHERYEDWPKGKKDPEKGWGEDSDWSYREVRSRLSKSRDSKRYMNY